MTKMSDDAILAMTQEGVALFKIGEVKNFTRFKVTHIPAQRLVHCVLR